MSDSEGLWRQNPVQERARRWTGIILSLGLFGALTVMMSGPDALHPLAPDAGSRLQQNLRPLSINSAIAAASVFDVELTEHKGVLICHSARGEDRRFHFAETMSRPAMPLAILLAVAGCIAGSSWGMGWIRRLMFVMLGLGLPLVLLPIVNGLAVGLMICVTYYFAIPNESLLWSMIFQDAIYLTAMLTVGIWWIIRRIAADETAPEDGRSLTRTAAPLAWAAVIGLIPAIGVILMRWMQFDDRSMATFGDLPDSWSLPGLIIGLLAALAAWGMLLRGVLARSSPVKWAWAPLIVFLVCPGSGMVLAGVFVFLAIAGNDPWQLACANRPISEADRDRIRIRRHLPLIPVATALWVIAILGAVPLIAIRLDWPIGTLFWRLRQPYIFWPAALGAVVLGGWDLWALRKIRAIAQRQAALRQSHPQATLIHRPRGI